MGSELSWQKSLSHINENSDLMPVPFHSGFTPMAYFKESYYLFFVVMMLCSGNLAVSNIL